MRDCSRDFHVFGSSTRLTTIYPSTQLWLVDHIDYVKKPSIGRKSADSRTDSSSCCVRLYQGWVIDHMYNLFPFQYYRSRLKCFPLVYLLRWIPGVRQTATDTLLCHTYVGCWTLTQMFRTKDIICWCLLSCQRPIVFCFAIASRPRIRFDLAPLVRNRG